MKRLCFKKISLGKYFWGEGRGNAAVSPGLYIKQGSQKPVLLFMARSLL